MNFRMLALLAASASPMLAGDWSPRLAADYLEARQTAWFEWPTAKRPGGPCVSCHTGLTYMLVRPALSRALAESAKTSHTTGLLESLRARLPRDSKGMFAFTTEPQISQAAAVEAVIAALCFAAETKSGEPLSPDALHAFDRLWSLQLTTGPAEGAWPWFSLGLSPWEAPESGYYAAAMAVRALAAAPADYRARPDVRPHVAALAAYLAREQKSQPLHHRLTLLWAAAGVEDLLPAGFARSTFDEALQKQRADGSWTIDSLGPWTAHARASVPDQGDPYATAVAVLGLQKSAAGRTDPRLARALAWLASQQDPHTGSWSSVSMNKQFPEGSMQSQFMREAATALSALALLGGR